MRKRTRLVSLALLTVGFGGCGYHISQSNLDEIAQSPIEVWVEASDTYMHVGRLIQEGNIEGAQAYLDRTLMDSMIEFSEYKGNINATHKITEEAKTKIEESIDLQINKINAHLTK